MSKMQWASNPIFTFTYDSCFHSSNRTKGNLDNGRVCPQDSLCVCANRPVLPFYVPHNSLHELANGKHSYKSVRVPGAVDDLILSFFAHTPSYLFIRFGLINKKSENS